MTRDTTAGRTTRWAFIATGWACTAAVPLGAASGADPDLARQGFAVVETYCAGCHGVEFSYPGLNMLIRESLLTSDDPQKPAFLVPGRSRESRIYLHAAGLRQDKMPPEDQPQPTPAELDVLARWIDAGAEYPTSVRPRREFVGERQLVAAIVNDVEAQPEATRPYLRYFTIHHLWNDPGTSDDQLALTRAAISKLVNSLSSQRQIVPPVPVGEGGLILRIDMRDYGWSERFHWLPLLAAYPYGLLHDDQLADRLYRASTSSLPYVRGDWFCYAATRPALYHRLVTLPGHDVHVGLPGSQQLLEKELGVDLRADIAKDLVMRAGMTGDKSGVSDHNRIVERHRTQFGYYWISYDSAGSDERHNHVNFPLGPKFPGHDTAAAFDHDGGEIIFSLPNGLQGYMLTTSSGGRLDDGPPAIVQDKNRHSGSFVIVNAISCMGCHRDGMVAFADSIRQQWEGRRGETADKVLRIYPKKEAMDKAVAADRGQFMAAVRQAMEPFLKDAAGKPLPPEAFPEPITDVSKRYDRDLDLGTVARELGLPADAATAERFGVTVSADTFPTVIRAAADLRRLELSPLAAGEKIKRRQWEKVNQRTSRVLQLGLPFEVR